MNSSNAFYIETNYNTIIFTPQPCKHTLWVWRWARYVEDITSVTSTLLPYLTCVQCGMYFLIPSNWEVL